MVSMRGGGLVLILLGFPLLPSMAMPADSVDFQLDAHRWEHRILLVFAPTHDADVWMKQDDRFEGREAGFRERDLLLLTLTRWQGTLRHGPEGSPQPLTEAATRRLYDHFDVPSDAFRVVLVGKDGTEKRRETGPVTVRSIFDTIDAMPMRQREMREEATGTS